MAQTKGWMPETIGEPPTILYWNVNQVVVPLALLVIGTMVGQMKLCLALIVLYFWGMSKWGERIPKGFGINFLYFIGLLPLKSAPSYFCKSFKE